MNAEDGKGLYRERALAYKLLGSQATPVVAIANHFRLQLGLWLLLLSLATYLLTQTTYRETLAARGVLAPSVGTQKIIAPATARVNQIYVSSGDRVEMGDVLATLSTDAFDERGVSVHQQRVRQLRLDRALLEEQLQTQLLTRQQSRRWSETAAENVRSERLNLDKEGEFLEIQLGLSNRNLQAASSLLEAGSSSTHEFDQQYRAHLDLLSREQSHSQRELQFAHELDAIDNSQQLSELELHQSILRLKRELQAIDHEIESVGNRALFTVVAQGTGYVAELGLEVGKPVYSNQPLFYINPIDSELEATIYVPAAVAGKLATGQRVLIRYDAFDFRLYGRQEATVIAIGQARLDPRETMLPVVGLTEPVFRVTAQLHRGSVQREAVYRLQPGSTFIADFVVAEMSLLNFIFKPILRLRGKVT